MSWLLFAMQMPILFAMIRATAFFRHASGEDFQLSGFHLMSPVGIWSSTRSVAITKHR